MNRTVKRRIGRILLYLAVILLVLWTLLPIIWMFISSIISENELLSSDKYCLHQLAGNDTKCYCGIKIQQNKLKYSEWQ